MKIEKIAVIGSGVMGSSIAAHIANYGFKVLLLDMACTKSGNKNSIVANAFNNLDKIRPSALVSVDVKDNIEIGNLDDDISKLKTIDWIIEVIIEDLNIKQNLYKKIAKYCKKDALISSNTSTIPLKNLLSGMSDHLLPNFYITHFFNPPRYMRLLELVCHQNNNKKNTNILKNFLDINLGKIIVDCNDTPGFIANRIGCYWLELGLSEAIKLNIDIDLADKAISRPFGIPKTGIFGLWDLIGIDLMPLMSKSLISNLDDFDDFTLMYKEHELINNMIKQGLIGKKAKSGFYKTIKNVDGNTQIKVMNLASEKYEDSTHNNICFNSLDEIINGDGIAHEFALRVMLKTLVYAASLIPKISNNICNIDIAIQNGYNWRYGPFELIDMIGNKNFIKLLKSKRIESVKIIDKLDEGRFYNKPYYFAYDGNYQKIAPPHNIFIKLSDYKVNRAFIDDDDLAVWDIGDNIACLELKTKMNILTLNLLKKINEIIKIISDNFSGMIIANDGINFCVGGDLSYILNCIKSKNFYAIEEYIKTGQAAIKQIKYCQIPIVVAHKGFAVGGGSELLMHVHHVVSHIEAKAGLVEAKVGLVPAWGGIKELLIKNVAINNDNAIAKALTTIVQGTKTDTAIGVTNLLNINNIDIIANIDRVIINAKYKAIELAKNFVPRLPQTVTINPQNHNNLLTNTIAKLELSPYDKMIAEKVKSIFCGNSDKSTEITISEDDIMNLELSTFLSLCQNNKTAERIDYMLKFGKYLI